MTEPTPQSIAAAQALLRTNVALIKQRKREQAIRDNLTSYLRQIFPDEPGWVNRHISDTETSTSIVTANRQKTGFIDNLVGLTFIEYEPNLLLRARFEGGLAQIKEYSSGLITNGASHQMTNSASERLCSVSRNRQLISAAKYHKRASKWLLTR
jgi:hypothetical protein